MFKKYIALTAICILSVLSALAVAVPLETFQDFTTANPIGSRKGQWTQLLGRGTGTNDFYVIEVDPVTGAIPVAATFSDPAAGPTGDPVPAQASYTAGVDGNGDLIGLSVESDGTLNVNADFSLLNDTDWGVVGANTLRTASVLGNATGEAAFGAGAVSAQVLRVTLATDDVVEVEATDLDTRDLDSATDSVTVGGSLPAGTNNIGDVDVTNLPATVSTNSGNADASTLRTVIAADQAAIDTKQTSVVSTANSTTATLGAGGVFTGTSEEVKDYGTISIVVFSNVASATNGLSVQFSSDGTNWDDVEPYTIAASSGRFLTFGPEARYYRLVYTNGATPQTVFRLQTIYHYGYIKPSSHRINEPINDENDAELQKAVITARSTGGTYVNIGATNGGSMKVSVEEANVQGFGAATTAQRVASVIGNTTGGADFNTGTAGAQTLRVVQASNSPAPAGRSYADSARLDYSSSNVTTGAWVEIDASTAAAFNAFYLFSSCGEALELGTGASASETRVALIPPGGLDGAVPLAIPAGTRLSVRGVSGSCTSGQLLLTGLN